MKLRRRRRGQPRPAAAPTAAPLNILEVLDDPNLLGPFFRPRASWRLQRVLLRAMFGLPLARGELGAFQNYTGRQRPPPGPVREAWVVAGRRSGKTFLAAAIAVYLAAFIDYRRHTKPGERVVIALVAADRKQARVAFNYIRGFLDHVPLLSKLVVAWRQESVSLSNGVDIEVATCNYRTIRGRTFGALVADEVAFWVNSDDGANPAEEVFAAARPGLATLPTAMLIAISSPHARRGPLWEAYRRHHGQDDDRVLCWQAPSAAMNPSLPQAVLDAAFEQDEAIARAEWGAEFRTDVETFLPRERLEAAVIPGRLELPPTTLEHYAFVDPSGGSADSFTLAIAHREAEATGDRVVLDLVREVRPPFSPEAVVREFAYLVKRYDTDFVTGDHYSGEWVRERFRREGVTYRPCTEAKSALYGRLAALVNSGRIELLDHLRLLSQLANLERRTARGGRESIDHPPRAHDDLANAVAGAAWEAAREAGEIETCKF